MEKTYSTSNTLLFEELYADAEALLTAGKKDYAFGLFYLLMEKNYGDSYLRVSEFKHDEALEHMAKGNYDDAYSILLN